MSDSMESVAQMNSGRANTNYHIYASLQLKIFHIGKLVILANISQYGCVFVNCRIFCILYRLPCNGIRCKDAEAICLWLELQHLPFFANQNLSHWKIGSPSDYSSVLRCSRWLCVFFYFSISCCASAKMMLKLLVTSTTTPSLQLKIFHIKKLAMIAMICQYCSPFPWF